MKTSIVATIVAASLVAAGAARAEITVGFVTSQSGPGASIGVLYDRGMKAAVEYAMSVGDEKIRLIQLDDGSDPSAATRNARKLVEEGKVDFLIGTATAPSSIAMVAVANELKVPMISVSPITVPATESGDRWAVAIPQPPGLMVKVVVDRMKRDGIKNFAYIGFSDAWGDLVYNGAQKPAEADGLKILTNERYARTDTSVTGQVLKIAAARPDAVLIAGSGTPAALPQKALKERGYAGKIYQTHGVANNDFLRVGGKDVEGTLLPAGPVLVAAQLPADHPVKKSALDYIAKYEAANGKGSVSTFGGHAWDAGLLLAAAAPEALKKAQPGTPAFRAALRDAIENAKNVAGAHGVFNMSPQDHLGLDQRARVMVEIKNGAWVLIK